MIKFQNVSFRYNDTEGNGISDINLHVKKGEFVLLSGASGCGKTTVTRCINGLIPHFYEGALEGSVLLKGRDVSELKLHEVAETVGSVFQDPRSQFFTTETVSEVAFACENAAIPKRELVRRVDGAISELKIEHLRGKSLFELSSGERQRVAIASVYALTPDVFVFDEPSANLDAWTTEELAETLALLKKRGATIVISEHRLYYLKDLIDKVVYMESGKITKEYDRQAFLAISDRERASMGLRCLYQGRLILPVRDNQSVETEATYANEEKFLRAEHLYFAYKKRIPLLRDINFKAVKGDIIGIIGRNGAGKSTFAELVCGLIKEQKGQLFFSSEPMAAKQRVPHSYFIMQDADYQLFSESVTDELALGNDELPLISERIEDVLTMLDLHVFRDRHPSSLSGGQKQRVVIAAAYIRDLNVVVFDEPTSGLDATNMKRVGALIEKMAQRGVVVFVITHDYELLVSICQRVIQMEQGCIVGDYPLDHKNFARVKQFFQIDSRDDS